MSKRKTDFEIRSKSNLPSNQTQENYHGMHLVCMVESHYFCCCENFATEEFSWREIPDSKERLLVDGSVLMVKRVTLVILVDHSLDYLLCNITESFILEAMASGSQVFATVTLNIRWIMRNSWSYIGGCCSIVSCVLIFHFICDLLGWLFSVLTLIW